MTFDYVHVLDRSMNFAPPPPPTHTHTSTEWETSDLSTKVTVRGPKHFFSQHTHIQRLCADLEDREARLRAQEEEMQQRDAEINRLMAELRRCQAQLLRQQV